MDVLDLLRALYHKAWDILHWVFSNDFSFLKREILGLSLLEIGGFFLAIKILSSLVSWLLNLGFDMLKKTSDRGFSILLPMIIKIGRTVLYRAWKTTVYIFQKLQLPTVIIPSIQKRTLRSSRIKLPGLLDDLVMIIKYKRYKK